MKSIKSFLLLLFLGLHVCNAQDTTLLLKPNMLAKDGMQIFISEMKGWLFKQGNDTAWAKKDIDLTGWKRLMPTELSEKMADKNGRVEGWFRLKVKIDSSFSETAFAVRISTWAASDLYINDKKVASSGNTGINGAPYKENRYVINLLPLPVNLKPGNEYTFVLHVVDYLSSFPPYELKAKDLGLTNLIKITVPKYYETVVPEATNGIYIFTIFAVISAVLSLLFWLLFFQNRSEKNLLLFAVASTFLTVFLVVNALLNNSGIALGGISYSWVWVCRQIGGLFILLYFISVPFILASIFKRKIPFILSIIFLFYSSFVIISGARLIAIDEKIVRASNNIFFTLIIIVSIYYVVSSWKKLKGAQWAIVAGLMFTLSMMFLIIIVEFISQDTVNAFSYLLVAVVFLSFPLSLMVYVAMRFKEIIKDVQENARQVVQMSEEKKEQALNQQKILQEEVNRQTTEIRTTLHNLKSTQTQLVQQEKLASLGALTAGIAHEIKNPLNFVNNFSELSAELVDEFIQTTDETERQEIGADLKTNLQKINEHGKRADSIVKNMLQHSRGGSGEKQLTDINQLCDEYFNLAFHGKRATDSNFNCEMVKQLENNLPPINCVVQDISRVVLNLINNAFDAVRERELEGKTPNYKPSVTLTTQQINNTISISISDNGKGIPLHIQEKIFEPFFTTKPAGQGTGLGLSLSYDIVKAHGGEMKLETVEGEGSKFVIQLPLI
jgi:signal transduction histidine kinase